MSLSTSALKFLLDENVRVELFSLFESKGIDAKLVSKGASDEKVACLSKKEERVLVTNDADFATSGAYSGEKLFALVWLRVSQGNARELLDSFELFLAKFKEEIEGKVVVLKKGSWKVFSLGSEDLTKYG